ncbi:Glucokinase [compost metagenome]
MIGAIDIGGTKIALALATPEGRLVAHDRFPTDPGRGPTAVIDEMIVTLRCLADKHGAVLTTIGVGSVGPLDLATGTIMSPPNFPGWKHVPLKLPLEAAFKVPVVIDNDANAAALGEYRLGAGKGARCMVYATLSTGIGGGVVIGGKLLHGVGGGAGEFGHQTIVPDGPACGCGNHGCFEAVASGTAIARRARILAEAGQAPLMLALAGGEPAALHAGHVAEAAAQGEATAMALWAETVEYLAIGLGNVISTLAPDRVVLGGGVAQVGDALLVPLREALARRVRMVPMDQVQVVLAAHGHETGLYGAVALALEHARPHA